MSNGAYASPILTVSAWARVYNSNGATTWRDLVQTERSLPGAQTTQRLLLWAFGAQPKVALRMGQLLVVRAGFFTRAQSR